MHSHTRTQLLYGTISLEYSSRGVAIWNMPGFHTFPEYPYQYPLGHPLAMPLGLPGSAESGSSERRQRIRVRLSVVGDPLITRSGAVRLGLKHAQWGCSSCSACASELSREGDSSLESTRRGRCSRDAGTLRAARRQPFQRARDDQHTGQSSRRRTRLAPILREVARCPARLGTPWLRAVALAGGARERESTAQRAEVGSTVRTPFGAPL